MDNATYTCEGGQMWTYVTEGSLFGGVRISMIVVSMGRAVFQRLLIVTFHLLWMRLYCFARHIPFSSKTVLAL